MKILAILFCVFGASPILAYEATSSYERMQVHGFTVLISNNYQYYPKKRTKLLAVLERQLKTTRKFSPPDIINRLTGTKIWVENFREANFAGIYFHGSAGMHEEGTNPAKAKSIQVDYYLVRAGADDPLLMLHEIAHAYHDQVLGRGNAALKRAFKKAEDSGKYDRVRKKGAARGEAYAMTNVAEYFAELTEAYFATNDEQPFNRKELKAFDPLGYETVKRAWKQ